MSALSSPSFSCWRPPSPSRSSSSARCSPLASDAMPSSTSPTKQRSCTGSPNSADATLVSRTGVTSPPCSTSSCRPTTPATTRRSTRSLSTVGQPGAGIRRSFGAPAQLIEDQALARGVDGVDGPVDAQLRDVRRGHHLAGGPRARHRRAAMATRSPSPTAPAMTTGLPSCSACSSSPTSSTTSSTTSTS